MGAESFQKNMEKGLIEVAPLAYMRGRTLIIPLLCWTRRRIRQPAQMKIFLTRIGLAPKSLSLVI